LRCGHECYGTGCPYPEVDSSSLKVYTVNIYNSRGGKMSTAKIFKSGNSQALRLPKEFQFDVPEVEIFRRGDEIVIKKKTKNLARVFELLTGLSDDFMRGGRNQPAMQRREEI
jgi:antitoxin VapB